MTAFVVVHRGVNANHSFVPEQMIAGLEPSAWSDPPAADVTWIGADGAMVMRAWSDTEAGSWQRSPRGIVALAGVPVAAGGRVDLLRRLASDPGSSVGASDTRNHFAVVSLAAADPGRGSISSDPYGLHPVYVGAAEGHTVVSNDSRLVAAAMAELGHPPRRDLTSSAVVGLIGHVCGNRTGYEDVTVLPIGHEIRLDGQGCEIVPRTIHPWTVETAPLDDERIGQIERDLHDFMALLVEQPGPTRSQLTGGKDSRLVMGIAVAAGFADEIEFVSYGDAGHPDVSLASEIATRNNLSWVREPWPPSNGFNFPDMTSSCRVTGGQLGMGQVSPNLRDGLTFNGIMGEALTTNFPGWRCHDTEQVVASMREFADRRGSFLRPEAHQIAEGAIISELEAFEDRGCPPDRVIDAYYLESRIRRWIGCRPTGWNGFAFPLYSLLGTEIAFATDRESRRRGDVIVRLLERCPAWAEEIEFTKAGSQNAHTKKAFATALAEKVKNDPAAREAVARKMHASSNATVISTDDTEASRGRTAVDDLVDRAERGSIAFDLVDTASMAEAANNYFDLEKQARQDLGNACTTFAWLAELDAWGTNSGAL
jgi:hypothetical protein